MTHEEQCSICQYGPESVDWGQSNVEIARTLSISEGSVRRHKKWAKANGIGPGERLTTVKGFTTRPETDIPGKWVPRRQWETPRGDVLNSFQFIPDESVSELHIDNERIDSLIRDVPDIVFPDVTEGPTEVLILADPQLGKAGERGGGTDETIARVYAKVKDAIETRYILNPPKQLVLVDGGDIIENIFSTPAQVSTNDRTLPEQVEDAIAMYVNVIGMLLPYVDELVHVAVTSNHAEARTAPKVNPYNSENDWGLMIQRQIAQRCEDKGWDVTFVRPGFNEDTAVVDTVDGTQIAFNHGHHSSSPATMKTWVSGQIVGRRPGWDADIWVMSHYHHAYHFPVGSGTTVFGTPALDGGSEWVARKKGESYPAGALAFTVDSGKWSNYTLL